MSDKARDKPEIEIEDEPGRQALLLSCALHGAVLLAAVLAPMFSGSRDVAQFVTTEVSVIDGADFDALVSSAPVKPSDAPDGPIAPAADVPPLAQPAPETAPAPPEPGPRALARPDPRPELPVIASPPPPTTVPTEAPRPSVAEIPVPDAPPAEAPVPESPPSTEPVQPLASRPVPIPGARPQRPPDPEPAPAELAAPEPELADLRTPEAETLEEPEAPEGAAPREARLPVARPADLAAASAASRETRQADARQDTERAEQSEPAPPSQAEAEPPPQPAQASGATRFSRQMSRGEKDALRIGIRDFFSPGSTSDRSLEVTIYIGLDPSGRIVEGPDLRDARGGTQATQSDLFRRGRRALLRAQNARVFAKLPLEKYEAWKRILVTFTPTGPGFSS